MKNTEMPESTEKLFDKAITAILMLVGKFAENAVEAGNREVIVQMGQHVSQLLNSALDRLDRAGQNDKYMQMQ